MTNVAATRFLAAQGSRLELVLPLAGIAVALYVLYHNVYPVPDVALQRVPLRGRGVVGRRGRVRRLAAPLTAVRAAVASSIAREHFGSRLSSTRESAGKMTTESSPAAMSAAALAGVTTSSARPTAVAATMNGSDVACISTATGTAGAG